MKLSLDGAVGFICLLIFIYFIVTTFTNSVKTQQKLDKIMDKLEIEQKDKDSRPSK